MEISTAIPKERYAVNIYKSTEGGPCLCDIKSEAKSMGLKIESYSSCYMGHVCIRLVRGTKKEFKKLLRNFGVDYLR